MQSKRQVSLNRQTRGHEYCGIERNYFVLVEFSGGLTSLHGPSVSAVDFVEIEKS